jgi:hypothetical protein
LVLGGVEVVKREREIESVEVEQVGWKKNCPSRTQKAMTITPNSRRRRHEAVQMETLYVEWLGCGCTAVMLALIEHW